MQNIIIKMKEHKIFSTFLIGIICVIIMTVAFMVNSYADMSFIVEKIVNYNAGGTVNIPLKIYTDVVRYHAKANGYDVKKGDESFNNASIYDSSVPDMISAPGYGQYVFKVHTDLFQFIEFCHEKNSAMTEQAALINDIDPLRACDYNKLMSFNGQANGNYKPYMDNFWTNMCILGGDTFRDWQDEYFFKEYTNKAISKNGYTARSLKNIEDEADDWEDSHTYLSALTSYLYMYMETKNSPIEDIKRGDMLPFIYYRLQTDEENPKEIAKYAYVALIENFDNFGINAETARAQWESEYYNFFDEYDLTQDEIETLEEWYGVAKIKYGTDKGRVRNNLLGSTIDTIIKSDYNMETQIEATKYYINQIFSELGIETSISEALSRNELMAKYMMENEQLKDMIKDYNKTIEFMTENLQRGTNNYENTHTVVTSDFQRLDFPYTINERYSHHSDEDGITDGGELGNEKWINITEFVKKAYESMPLSDKKNTFEAQVDDIIYKNQGIIKKEGMADNIKVLYRTFNYTSNPKLNDTDFDGLNDNIDTKKLDNYINSTNKVDEDKKVDVTYGSDFRYFFINNSKFNDELAMMSFIVSNLATDNRTINIDQDGSIGYININTYMQEMGFMPIETIDLYGGKAKCYTGVKEIQYYDIKKYVYCAFVGGFTDIESYVDLLYNDDGSEEEKFKEIADIIYDKLQNYTKNGEYCYWVTGMNIAGGVANLLACELKGEECYAYIMDPPNISRSDYGTYNYIMNIVNEDNLIPKIYKDTRNHINGRKFNNSVGKDLIQIYRRYDKAKNYQGNFKTTNRIRDEIQEVKDGIGDSEQQKEYFTLLTQDLYGKLLTNNSSFLYNSGNIIKTVDENGEEHIHENITEIDRVYAMNSIGESLIDGIYPVTPYSDVVTTYSARHDIVKPTEADGIDGFSENSTGFDEKDERQNTESNLTENEADLREPRNGYSFNMINDYSISDEDKKGYNYNNGKGSEEETVMIKPFMYSGYTLKGVDYQDINYVKFWSEKNNNVPKNAKGREEQLYYYDAGDMSQHTHCTHGSDQNKKHINKYDGEIKADVNLNLGTNNGNLLSIDDRIIAAFPSALFNESFGSGEFETARTNMNKWDQYDINNIHNNGKDGGEYHGASIAGTEWEDVYKLVDVVIEEKSTNQQFVVPFVVIDAKNVHFLPNYRNYDHNYLRYECRMDENVIMTIDASREGMYSTLTDNRYGQVMEHMTSSNPKLYPYFLYKYYDASGKETGETKWLSEMEHKQSIRENAIKQASGQKIEKEHNGKTIVYFDRDEQRTCDYISPIEPYIKEGSNTTGIDMMMTNLICGNGTGTSAPDYRIVSMRLYEEKCAESNGEVNHNGTWKTEKENIQENTKTMKRKYSIPYSKDDISDVFFNREHNKNDKKQNTIVKYEG